jgi:protein gp37
MKQAHRFSGAGKPYEGLTKLTKAGPQWTGVVRTDGNVLIEPLSWRKPRRVFVNSMSDLFHEDVPTLFIDRVFAVMALCSQPGARLNRLHWIIAGGESGHSARPSDEYWYRWLRAQARSADVSFFMKQLGDVPMLARARWERSGRLLSARNHRRVPEGFVPLKFYASKAGEPAEWPEDLRVREFPGVRA